MAVRFHIISLSDSVHQTRACQFCIFLSSAGSIPPLLVLSALEMSSMASMLGPFLVEHFWRWDTGVAPRWSYPLGGEPTRLLASPSSRVEFVFLRMGFHSSNVQTLTSFIAASPASSWSIQMSVERGVSWTAECKIVFTSSYRFNWFVDFCSKVGRIGSSYFFLRLDGVLKMFMLLFFFFFFRLCCSFEVLKSGWSW